MENNGTYDFSGSIAGVQLYNTALTATEVKELYSGASVPFKYKGASQTLKNSGTFINTASFAATLSRPGPPVNPRYTSEA